MLDTRLRVGEYKIANNYTHRFLPFYVSDRGLNYIIPLVFRATNCIFISVKPKDELVK
jgi:hypothetical protein